MANISKAALVDELKGATGISQKDVKTFVEGFLEQLAQHLKAGNKVQLTGFGTFEVREQSARTGVNPATKKKLTIPAREYAVFEPGKA